ncbi:putative probable phosphoglycerate mutase ARB_03491 [[Candida] jaroonii]|uniref:Probable phosphoglycerate mutase ARB_03491 n=1 Tax=[Candida] jaroonii TaxID=467808 RepID=A0ACA9Y8G7_9ASCO|nr:putative probable phosphoglycerate mutase ARB_03491 [[Candida] jaroonii]
MSLLIPTEVDWIDAHKDNGGQEPIYRTKLQELKAQGKYKWDFEVVPGFFKQCDDSTDDLKFNYALEDLGRLKSWEDIQKDLKSLNENADDNVCYKLIFCSRHGQGYHNTIVDKYGFDEWNRYWHKQTHDGDIEFGPDAMLTERGIKQAEENHQVWKDQVAKGAPIPSKFFVSPLQRSSWTLVKTWTGIKPDSIHPVVTQNIRETCGVNLCDKRSSKTIITERFGKYGFEFEPGFTEEDEFFDPNERESLHHHALRTNDFLQSLFDADLNGEKVDKSQAIENTFISTTSHAGTIRTFIIVTGHRHFTISTGGMIPIVVKGTRN